MFSTRASLRFDPADGSAVLWGEGGIVARGATGRPIFPRLDPCVIGLVEDPAGERILLVENARRPGYLTLVAGYVDVGETLEAACAREVWEETGIKGEAFEELGVIDYWFVSEGVRIHKTVHHNLLRFVDGILNDEDPEVTEVTWVPMSELIEHLAYADERKLARIAYDRMPDLARKEADAGRATPR